MGGVASSLVSLVSLRPPTVSTGMVTVSLEGAVTAETLAILLITVDNLELRCEMPIRARVGSHVPVCMQSVLHHRRQFLLVRHDLIGLRKAIETESNVMT